MPVGYSGPDSPALLQQNHLYSLSGNFKISFFNEFLTLQLWWSGNGWFPFLLRAAIAPENVPPGTTVPCSTKCKMNISASSTQSFLHHLFSIFVICLALCSYKQIEILHAITLLGLCPWTLFLSVESNNLLRHAPGMGPSSAVLCETEGTRKERNYRNKPLSQGLEVQRGETHAIKYKNTLLLSPEETSFCCEVQASWIGFTGRDAS